MIDWLARIVEQLNAALSTIGHDAVSWAEFLGFVTGGLCVALTVRRNILNFPIGIANNAFFLVPVHLSQSVGGLGPAGALYRARFRRVVALAERQGRHGYHVGASEQSGRVGLVRCVLGARGPEETRREEARHAQARPS